MADLLLQRLLLDAQDTFRAAIAHVPNPGRGGAIGSLNPSAWTIAHAAAFQDIWLNGYCHAGPRDSWAQAWFEQAYSGPAAATAPPFADAVDAFDRITGATDRWLATVTWDDLRTEVTLPDTAPAWWGGVSHAYLVARSIAHLYVHAGELSVLAALMAAGDLGLPGPQVRSTPPVAPDDPSVPVVAALLRDGFAEVTRTAAVVPQPAVVGAMDRLNPVSHTLVHLLGREDRYWTQDLLGQPTNARLAALQALDPERQALAVPWEEALATFAEVEATLGPWLASVDGQAGAQPCRGDSSVGSQLARSATHFFSHAGEMLAHASLYGVADIGQPGPLAHVREATTPR